MRKKLSKTIFILIISLFIHPLIGYSQEELPESLLKERRDTLKGLRGVYVLIEQLHPKTIELGITEELLKTDVELKLRLAGIRVYSKEEHSKNPMEIPMLQILFEEVRRTLRGITFYPYYLELPVIKVESVYSLHKDTVWAVQDLSASTREDSLKHIRESMKRLSDTFLNDYLAVNPKK